MNEAPHYHKDDVRKLSDSDLYDLYSPAVYGHILRMVPVVPIAGKVMEKVFLHAFKHRNELHQSLRAPLSTLLNDSRNRTQAIIEALHIFRECCAGASVHISEKEKMQDQLK